MMNNVERAWVVYCTDVVSLSMERRVPEFFRYSGGN
jgi:hypothetical protein